MQHELTSPQDYLAILKRRKWHIIIPCVLLSLISAVVAYALPPVYRSMGIILIEQPDIPPQLVASTITTYADERLQVIKQKVTTSQNLLAIIDKYNLYQEQRKYTPVSKLVSQMRDAAGLELISAEGQGRGNNQATIAFEVSFEYGDPVIAQRVANELISLYLSENVRARQEKAAETSAFLASEAQRLEETIADLDGELAEFKRRNVGNLPEQLDNIQQGLIRAEGSLRALDQREISLKQSQMFLERQLLQIDPYARGAESGISVAERLRQLRTELVQLSTRYTPQHPTVMQMREEVAALEKAVGNGSEISALRNERDRLQTELALAMQTHSENHPRVVALKEKLGSVEREMFDTQRRNGGLRDGVPADNPAYLQVEMQLEGVKTELAALAQEREHLKSQMANYEQRLEQAPLVQAEYNRLNRAYDGAVNELRSIRQKQVQADLGETLETERKGERFSLIEPPQAPDEPIKPKRSLILTLGLLLSFGVGIGAAVLAEAMDTAIHGARQLANLTGVMPLVSIPYIRTRSEVRKIWRRRAGFALGTAGLLAGLIVSVHLYVSPLDVLWARLERQVEHNVMPLAIK